MANYLYNGAKLTALPEWDKSAYPYAILRLSTADPTQANLYILSVRPYKKADSDSLGILEEGTIRSAYCYGEAWGSFGFENSIHPLLWDGIIPFWTNTDILNEDGSVYLAASDPIPVNPPDPLSLVMGYRVGCAIRANR